MKMLINYMKSRRGHSAMLFTAIVSLLAMVVPEMAAAAAADTSFTQAVTTVEGWATGSLGKLVSVTFLVVGIVMGVMRQSIFAAVPAIACALAMSIGPGILDGLFTATIK